MNRTKIEWCTHTWNPVTGCFHGCTYCYARRIAERFSKGGFEAKEIGNLSDSEVLLTTIHRTLERPFMVIQNGKNVVDPYPLGFSPTFHHYRLDEPAKMKKPARIFVVSMGDLFGDWVPTIWIKKVLESCVAAPQHKYLFLTKNPIRYDRLIDMGLLPRLDNFWYGTTVTDLSKPMHWNDRCHTFISVEPMLAPWPKGTPSEFPHRLPEWVIVGAETGNRKGKIVPEKWWIENLVEQCRKNGWKVFMKDSLIPIIGEENMVRDFPDGLRL